MKKNMTFFKAIKTVINYTKEYKKWYVISIILMILFIMSEIATNTTFSYSLSGVIEGDYNFAIKNIIIYIFVSFVGLNILHYFHHKISKKVSIEFAKKIRVDLYKKVLSMTQRDFEKINVGELLTTIENANEQLIRILTKFLWATTKILYLIILYIIIFFINVYVALLVSITLILLIILTKIYFTKCKKITDFEYEKTYEASTLLNQTVYGFKELRFIDSNNTFIKKYENVNNDLYNLKEKKANYWVNTNVLRWDIYKLNDLFFIILSIILISKFNFDTTKVILLNTYISNIINIFFSYIIENSVDIPDFIKNIEKNVKILEENEIKIQKFGNKKLNNIKGLIQFKNVSYKYENSDFELKDITFDILPNNCTAIIGKSGSGKSTILKLLSRYYDDFEGSITIDGINIKEINKESFINCISIVHQDPFIFNMSIKENILISNPDCNKELFNYACKQSKLDEFIDKLPDGYNTIINDKSTNLSGGQKQRIAIARAIIKNSKIILFDEPTSALDDYNTKYIKSTIKELSKTKTIIVISHNEEFIKDFDKIIKIKDGKYISRK